MNSVIKMVIFSILLNFATGIMMTAIVDSAGNPVFNVVNRGDMPAYNESYSSDFVGNVNASVTPGGEMQDEGDMIYRVLDMLNVGWIARFINGIKFYMFGFMIVMAGLFGGGLTPDTYTLLFGGSTFYNPGLLGGILILGYLLAMWSMWTSKNLDR